MSQNKERFIILRTIKYAEADLIVHGLSPQGEKVSFIARGALRSKKRFGGGVLEPTHFVQFTYKVANEGGQLNTLNEATLINDFAAIRRTYDHLEFALHALECVGQVSQEGDKNSEFLFNLLGHTLKALETATDPGVLKMHFYLKFLFQQGVIETEPWMAPFLRTNLADTNKLIDQKDRVFQEYSHVEAMVQHYIKNATL